jgi:hypothetical protein
VGIEAIAGRAETGAPKVITNFEHHYERQGYNECPGQIKDSRSKGVCPGDTDVAGDVRHPKSRSLGDKPRDQLKLHHSTPTECAGGFYTARWSLALQRPSSLAPCGKPVKKHRYRINLFSTIRTG